MDENRVLGLEARTLCCVKSIQIGRLFWSVFSCIQYFLVFGPKTGNYEPEKTSYLDTFHAVLRLTKAV